MFKDYFAHFEETNIYDSVVSVEEGVEQLKLSYSFSQILLIPLLHVSRYFLDGCAEFFDGVFIECVSIL